MLELYGRELAWQWDTGQSVVVDGISADARVHFAPADSQTAYVVATHASSGHTMADVPNILLQAGGLIRCWVSVDGETTAAATITVRPRPKPDDYVYTPTEVETIESLKTWVADQIARVAGAQLATTATPGLVIVGDNLTVEPTGRLSADQGRITYMDNNEFLTHI